MPQAPLRQTRAEKKADTRERLLAAAEAIATNEGFGRITLEAVAAAAGLTKGAIYSNFASKEDLVLEVVVRLTPGMNITPEVEDASDLASLLQQTAEATAKVAGTRSKQVMLALEFDALVMRDIKLRRAMKAAQARERAADPETVDDWFAEKGIELPIPAEQFALVVSALAIALIQRRVIDGAAKVPDELISWALGRFASSD
jgi:AcrR family transcriptional regulator